VRLRNLTWALLVVAACGPLATRGTAQDRPTPDQAASLIENLKAENVEVRRNAAARIRMSDTNVQRKALPALIALLEKEKDGQVRLAVLDAVTALGHDAEPAVPALLLTLRTSYGGQEKEELHQDYRAALALAAVGKPAVEGLRGLLKERKESVRAEAVMALGRIGPDALAAIPELVLLLGDKNERIRREASVALGRIGMAAVEPLIAAAAHKDALIRAGAVESLGYSSAPNDQVQLAVLKCAQDAAPEVRAAAVKSLAAFEVPDDVLLPILKENLRHEDERVRLAVVNLLVKRRALLLQMAPELASLLTAELDGVARHAAFLLGKIGPEAAPLLLKALDHEKSRIDQVAEALSQIGRQVVELLTQAIRAPQPRVRRGAALALGQIRPLAPGTAQKLTAGLRDPDHAVRAAFLTAIGYLGSRASESVPAVRDMLQDESAEIRVQAIDILSQSAPHDDRLLGDFTELLNDPDAQVQRQAIDHIRFLGPMGSKALTVIIGKLDSSSPEVRLAAAEFVESQGQAASEAVPALSALLDDATPKIRTIAAQSLGKMGKAAQPAFARLTSLLGAEQVEVREAATLALGSLELDAEVIRPHLAKALRDDKAEVRRAAMRAIQKLGPQGAIFVPDIILLAESKENRRSVERSLRRFESKGPDVRSIPELVRQLNNDQETVRLLAIKFLKLAGASAKEALPALERLREDPSAEVRKQAEAATEQIKNNSAASQQ
jgi:HEAT repeat protein